MDQAKHSSLPESPADGIPPNHGKCRISGEICPFRQNYRIKLPWPDDLSFKRGARTRLRGIEIYFDFNWLAHFGHQRAAFKNGEHLARFILKECPDDKEPALVLTLRGDVVGGLSFDWGRYFVVVVNIDQYLAFTGVSPAVDFFALRLTKRLTRLADLEESDIADWAQADPTRVSRLAAIAERLGNPKLKNATSNDLTQVLESLEMVDESTVDLIVELLGKRGVEAEFLLKRVLEIGGAEDLSDVLEWLLSLDDRSIARQFSRLQGTSLEKLSSLASFLALNGALATWNANRSNDNEEFWQQMLQTNSFVLSQVFAAPVVVIRGKAYVGGKNIENKYGSIADFLCKNPHTHNTALIEIKTPTTSLLSGAPYRGDAYNVGSEVSGAIVQVATQRDSFLKECHSLLNDTENPMYVYAPKCAVIVGNAAQLSDSRKVKSFELFRNSLSGIEIVTFDELFGRIRSVVDLIDSRQPR